MEENKFIALSIVVPLYNEEPVIDELLQRLTVVAATITPHYEIILINDASRDSTLLKIKSACVSDPHISYLSFSRNFGHQIAISAGMNHAKGNAIITIDGDLQDPPELMGEMYKKFLEGYKVVYAKRGIRKGETLFSRPSKSL